MPLPYCKSHDSRNRIRGWALVLACAIALVLAGARRGLCAPNASPATFESVAAELAAPGNYTPAPLAARGRRGASSSSNPVNIRLGALVSPEVDFDGGLDVGLPSISVGQGWSGRLDLDVIARSGGGTLVPFTFDQIYHLQSTGSARLYAGGGVGIYFGSGATRVGGKLVFGGYVTQKLAVELNVHFPSTGDTLLTVQARIGLH